MKNRILFLLAAAVIVVGCQSAVAAKPLPKLDLAKCVASTRLWDITIKHQFASFMGVSLDRMPALICQRIYDGLRTGRISFSDINAIQFDQPTAIWKVIKGK